MMMTIMIIEIIMLVTILIIISIIITVFMMVRPSKYCGSPHQRLVQRREPGRALISFLNNDLDHDHGVDGEDGDHVDHAH